MARIIVRKCVFWTIMMFVLGLEGCSGVRTKSSAGKPILVPMCLSQAAYSKDFDLAVLAEIKAHEADLANVQIMLGNYADMRDQNRKCLVRQSEVFKSLGITTNPFATP